ncbi:DUF2000 domain-containing protein [Actinokineospora bangkokensis]|uniref:DUF2000 domain-containing protein n=1 Tax=Actinokineospora bangkokensis TaxID=1193682 RepID=A0A1Q9LLE2_9PSEU|nr:DUF2000 domain-containing protein [Actinokineospora bangkokensis]OLR92813.1 hypothetical protein BJP25_19485 [Actinokineospora bangkokensis]
MALPTKMVLVVRSDLAPGEAVNAAVVVGLSLGARTSHLLGAEGEDASGGVHAALNPHPVPVLTATPAELEELHRRAREQDEVTVVGFNDTARQARDHDDYLNVLAQTPGEHLRQVAVALFGPRALISPLTRRLRLLGAGA